MAESVDAAAKIKREKPPDMAGFRPRSKWLWARYLWRDKKAVLGLIFLAVMTLSAVFAPYIATHDPRDQTPDFLEPPSAKHLLGTDDLGRDLFSRIVFGARVSLFVGISTVLICGGSTCGARNSRVRIFGARSSGWPISRGRRDGGA